MVLLGEHLGRGEQRGLPPGVDHLEHRAERDERLARAHLALQEAVHRMVPAQLVGDQVADLALTTGQLERQPRVEGGQQPVVAAGAGPGTLGAVRRPAPGEHELEHQRLLEAEALLGGADLASSRRGRGPSAAPA